MNQTSIECGAGTLNKEEKKKPTHIKLQKEMTCVLIVIPYNCNTVYYTGRENPCQTIIWQNRERNNIKLYYFPLLWLSTIVRGSSAHTHTHRKYPGRPPRKSNFSQFSSFYRISCRYYVHCFQPMPHIIWLLCNIKADGRASARADVHGLSHCADYTMIFANMYAPLYELFPLTPIFATCPVITASENCSHYIERTRDIH